MRNDARRPTKGLLLLMLTREEDIDAHALHKQGWTITASSALDTLCRSMHDPVQ